MNAQALDKFRQQRDEFFRSSPQSPLSPDKRKHFTGLRYFPYVSALDLKLTVTRFDYRSDLRAQDHNR